MPAGPITREAEIQPESINAEARSFEVIFSKGSPVNRRNWWTGERYVETLSLEPGAVRLGRINSGRAPFLDSHSGYRVADVMGRVEEGSAKVTSGAASARVVLDTEDENALKLWGKITRGFVRNISVGYDVHAYEKIEPKDRSQPIEYRATDWEPYEISAVPMGADDEAKIRSADQASARSVKVIIRGPAAPTKESPTMDPKTSPRAAAVQPNEDGTCPEGYELVDGECRLIEAPTERDLGAQQETERVQGILAAAAAVRRSSEDPLVKKLIAERTPLVQAQGILLDTLRAEARDSEGPRVSGRVRVQSDPLANVWRGIEGALLHRVDSTVWKLDENSRQYRSRSLLAAAEECLEQRGIRTRHLSKNEIAKLAFSPMDVQVRAGMHTTSDFANILADVANKTLRRAYEAAPATWQAISRRIELPDFKAVKRNQIGEAPALHKVLEHGEFTRGTVAEGKEQFQLATWGRIFGITRQALINDDLDAFARMTSSFGRSARNLESDVIWYQILKNALMGDGVALFDAGHGNVSGGAGAIAVATLGVGRAKLRMQTALDGVTLLNLMAKSLIVPPALETIADQFVTVITPEQGGNVNPFAGKLQVVAEPRLESGVTLDGDTATGSATVWYLGASPDQIDMIEYGYLSGDEGPVVESRVGFDVDGLETKCRLDFAAKAIDHRGFYRNSA